LLIYISAVYIYAIPLHFFHITLNLYALLTMIIFSTKLS